MALLRSCTGRELDGVSGWTRGSPRGVGFLAHVVGECRDTPNLKQIFSKKSDYSLLITEYVERCHQFEGFFTRDNVAALTEAAGEDERFAHGHVLD